MGVYSGLSLYWPELTGDELRGALVELEDWVAWARAANRRLDDVLRECWPLHPGVVQQLAAWQAWWWAIYRPRLSGDRPPARGVHSGQAAIAWWDSLERGLPRLAEELRSCRRACAGAFAIPGLAGQRRWPGATWHMRSSSECWSRTGSAGSHPGRASPRTTTRPPGSLSDGLLALRLAPARAGPGTVA